MNIHSGHRERMKQRFRETGFQGFSDVNALELLLFYAVPRQDTNPIAHALLNRFGSFHDVIDASYEDLLKVPGVGANTATFLKLVPEICKRYTQGKQKRQKTYVTMEELQDYVIPLFSFEMEETLFMICMNSANRITYCEAVSQGGLDYVPIDPRKILEIALDRKTTKVVLAHNHPSGVAAPSLSDVNLTKSIKECLALFNIELLDHFIVAEEMCVSMRHYGVL